MTIEQHIEELRAELRNAVDPVERRWIAVDLDRAQAELDAMGHAWTEEDGIDNAGPPS